MYEKRATDVDDIKKLVKILKDKYDLKAEIAGAKVWLPASFMRDGRRRAKRFMTSFLLERDESWISLTKFRVSVN